MVTREFPHKSEGEVLSAYRLHIRLKYRGVLVRADRLRSTRLCNSGTHRSQQQRDETLATLHNSTSNTQTRRSAGSESERVSYIDMERSEEMNIRWSISYQHTEKMKRECGHTPPGLRPGEYLKSTATRNKARIRPHAARSVHGGVSHINIERK